MRGWRIMGFVLAFEACTPDSTPAATGEQDGGDSPGPDGPTGDTAGPPARPDAGSIGDGRGGDARVASPDGGGTGASSALDGGGGTGGTGGARSTDGGMGGPECRSTARPATAPNLQAGVWTVINPSGPRFTGEVGGGVGSLAAGHAFDPCNPSTLYLCLGDIEGDEGGLYKSTDGGSHWNRIGNLDQPLRLRVDPKNSLHLYVADGVRGKTMGFWVSWDGGNTWARPPGWANLRSTPAGAGMSFDDLYDLAVDPADFNHILVTSHSQWSGPAGGSAGVLESKDGGTSWIVHMPIRTWGAGHGIWFLKNGASWLIGTQGNGYWRTTNSGASWAQVTTQDMAHGGGQLYTTKTGVRYATSVSGVLRSVDDGVTWMQGGPVKFITGIFGDGTTLYTHRAYTDGLAPFYSSPESDGITWAPYGGGTQKFTNGPFEMSYDELNGIIYSSNWGNGMLALKVIKP